MHKIGYARVSSVHQKVDRQLGALRAERCDQIFQEKVSGKSMRGRPQLDKAIDALGTGDVLVVAEWDRATRSMMDGIAIIDRVLARGALVKVLDKAHLDLITTITKRANEGRAAALARGVRVGRKPKLTRHQQDEALKRLAAGESRRSIARTFNVSHTTVSRLQA